MGATAEYVMSGNRIFGPANLEVYHDAKAVWQYFSKIESAEFTDETEKRTLETRRDGQDVEIESRATKSRARLRISALEAFSPDLLQLIHGDKGTTQTLNTHAVKWEEVERRLWFDSKSGDGAEARTAYTPCNQTHLPEPDTFSAAAPTGTDGSGWSFAGNPDYYFRAAGLWFKPGNVTVPTESTVFDTDKLDANWVVGAPSATGVPVNFSAANEHVVLTGTRPVGENAQCTVPPPDYIVILAKATDSVTGSVVAAVGTLAAFEGAGITALTLTGGDTYAVSRYAKFYHNTGTNDNPTWTELAIDTDITWDEDRGAFKWLSAAVGTQYRAVKCAYFFVQAYNVEGGLGRTKAGQDLRQIRVISVEPEQFRGTPQYDDGMEMLIFKADFAGLSSKMSFRDGDWSAPEDIDLICLADATNNSEFGTYKRISQKFAGYEQEIA